MGLLVGVGLTVWLSSTVLDRERDGVGRRPATSFTAPDEVGAGVALAVEPHEELDDGQVARVSSTAFAAGATVTVRQCLTPSPGTALVLGGATCDEGAAPREVVVDARGHLVVDLVVRNVVTAGGLPYDCAGEAGFCSVVASTTAGEVVRGSAAISFRAGVRPEITLPGS